MEKIDLKLVTKYARTAHKHQLDRQGALYIGHPMRVALDLKSNGYTPDVIAVGLLHDVCEDCEGYDVERVMRDLNLPKSCEEPLRLLCHDKTVDYQDYIEKIAENQIARYVKMADLRDNMDVSRFRLCLSKSDVERLNKYIRAYNYLKKYEIH